MRFTNPAGDRIVADGKWMWIYLPSSNPGQVIKMPVQKNGAGVPDIAARFLTSPEASYTVSDGGSSRIAGRDTRAIVLVPKTESQPFTKAIVWVDAKDGLVRQFETVEGSGIVRRVTLTTLKANTAVTSSTFVFTPPKGVKVFEQGSSDR